MILKNDYDLTYLDRNNLYGSSISQYLPYEKFE